jgi:hypothetical protein
MRAPSLRVHKIAWCLAALACATTAAGAETCAERTVSARGEPSSFEVVAKAKARGNWRAQVRALPGLGPLYANWNIAQGTDYACSEGADGYVCTAIARPCRN